MQIAAVIAQKLRGLSGWRRAALAALLGAISASAHAPSYILPALFMLSALPWLLAGAATKRAAFAIGWWFGFGMLTAGLYWISNALLVDSAKTAWLLPFAAAGLPSVLAIFYGLATLATHMLRSVHGTPSALILAIFWMLAEWLRGHLFTGFPWNLAGYVWGFSDTLLQSTAYIGIYGLSFMTILAALCFSPLGLRSANKTAPWRPAIVTLSLFAVIWLAGNVRLNTLQPSLTGPMVRVVQGNVPQHQKWQNDHKARHISQYLQMTAAPPAAGDPPPRAVIWPETAMALFLNDSPEIRTAIGQVAPRDGFVLTGSVRAGTTATGRRQVWNSMFAIDADGQVRAVFDKFHLVPFGEYVPLKAWIPLPTIVESISGFSPGPGPRTLQLPGLPAFSPLICYEAIFPGQVRAKDGQPAALMINFTNDAWYGVSSGPYQHFVATQVRAIEEGVPLIRAANTGISALFDATGQVRARLGLNETGFFDVAIPAALQNPTLYAQLNDIPLFICLIVLFGWVVTRNWRGQTYTEG
ncbi:MAG: apolipoprotein N-acyltransferase [Nisaea sp.]|nr:apolipoprotein N-acyltransferase [Nisaea sp.]OUX92538.1 MAG: apolipoprotein N-acyltransferase [Candidatus Endolissoclinum sp. TMED26]